MGAVQEAKRSGGDPLRKGEGGVGEEGAGRRGVLRAAAGGERGALREAEGGGGAGGARARAGRLRARAARQPGRQLRRAAGLPHDQRRHVPGHGQDQCRRRARPAAQDQCLDQRRRGCRGRRQCGVEGGGRGLPDAAAAV